jgi:phosphoribosylamine-glycine ligase
MKMKALLVGAGAREHAIAEQLSKGAELYSIMPKKHPGIAKLSEEILVHDPTDSSVVGEWAKSRGIDVAFVSPDALLAAGVTDTFADIGIPVASPLKNAARIEWDKGYARTLMQTHKIPGCPILKICSSLEEAESALSEIGEVVVKPLGLTGGKGVKIQGEHLNSKEEILAYCKELLDKDGNVLLEEKLDGEEFTLQAFCDGSGLALMPPVQDHKRAFEGDKGPNCYSNDTEILTTDGWKTFGKLGSGDLVATFQPRFKRIRFEKPKARYWRKYSGEMIRFKHREIDLLVTPNHRMLAWSRKGAGKLEVIEARDWEGEKYLPQIGRWVGTSRKYFSLPKSSNKHGPKKKSVKIEFGEWAEFLGLFLSEGYTAISKATGARVYICQTRRSKTFGRMKAILGRLPFKFTHNDNKFRIDSVQMATYLREFGTSRKKYVPAYIKEAKPEIIWKFLKAFHLGDGSTHRGQMRFHSSSERLIGDIQELLMKTGRVGVITVDKREKMTSPLTGKQYSASPVYSIEVKKRQKVSIRKNNIGRVNYSGYIGCVTVSTGFVVVRRNGRIAICGNTGGMGSYSTGALLPFLRQEDLDEAKSIMEKTLSAMRADGAPFTGILYGQFILTGNGLRVIEFNARFGDPEAMNVLILLKTSLADIFLSMSKGKLIPVEFSGESTVVKYVVPEGYPQKGKADELILFDQEKIWDGGSKLFFGSVYETEKGIFTSTSRTAAAAAHAEAIEDAERRVEEALSSISGPLWHRKDIGTKELIERKVEHIRSLRP